MSLDVKLPSLKDKLRDQSVATDAPAAEVAETPATEVAEVPAAEGSVTKKGRKLNK